MNALEKAIRTVGTASALAAKVGVLPMAVTQWKKRGVPAERCLAIEAATMGVVTRYELRPDIYGNAGPMSATSNGLQEEGRAVV